MSEEPTLLVNEDPKIQVYLTDKYFDNWVLGVILGEGKTERRLELPEEDVMLGFGLLKEDLQPLIEANAAKEIDIMGKDVKQNDMVVYMLDTGAYQATTVQSVSYSAGMVCVKLKGFTYEQYWIPNGIYRVKRK